ncbi:unnamed protein product [Ostreobium quekettii]|uniref:Uncharacterized protein n=1 Tax=Ostreobium quekettii TaxID=121088 RepID=A0A8S1IUX6_9CHLO|nr:unnamed protein product [Ostreobium quekettii]
MEMSPAAVYDKWFVFADKDNDGRLSGPDAVQFFERSGLPRDILAKVWALADRRKDGYLNCQAFHKAMQLISMAQKGIELSHGNHERELSNGIPMPQLDGMAEVTASISAQPAKSVSSYEPAQYQGTPEKSSRKKQQPHISTNTLTSVVDGLKKIYFEKIRPLEDVYKFGHFYSPLLNASDFEAKPSVLLLGQYSTGKTTFIKHLLERDYPGCHIGPEPTTDRFVVVMSGHEERRTPGNTIVVQPDKPYQGLSIFGHGFLSRFESAECSARLLDEITLVDTPGVLSGEKQRIERSYDFIGVCGWFASRCDLILLLFDPYKLDISDEFKQVISSLKGHDDKVRVVLNKADQVGQQQLMRVYGALMWSLGKVFKSPEVCRVYIGSFNAGRSINEENNPHGVELFRKEQEDLLHDLLEIPQRSCDRKVNEFVKRVRAAKIHILLMGHLRKQLPNVFGKGRAQDKVLAHLPEHFNAVRMEHHLPAGDFPDVNRFREILQTFDLASFPKLDKKMIKTVEDALAIDIPDLIKMFHNPYE